jgi:CheY-like chemotaxis protein
MVKKKRPSTPASQAHHRTPAQRTRTVKPKAVRPPLSSASVVAVLNSNQDVLRLIRSTLQDEGYTVATEHIVNFKDGEASLSRFLTNHQPAVVVYDLAPPYEENWNFLQLLRKIPDVAAIPMVLTTVNKAALERAVGRTDAFEIVGTRDNLGPVVEEINRVFRSRR